MVLAKGPSFRRPLVFSQAACKRAQQLPTLLRACWQWCSNGCNNSQQVWELHCIVGRVQPISLRNPCVMSVVAPKMLEELCKQIQHCWATLRRSRNKRNVGSVVGWEVWPVSNFTQQHPTTCNRVCKRTQHVTSNNVTSVCTGLYIFYWMGGNKILRPTARFVLLPNHYIPGT